MAEIPAALVTPILERDRWRAAANRIAQSRRTDDRLRMLLGHFAQRWGTVGVAGSSRDCRSPTTRSPSSSHHPAIRDDRPRRLQNPVLITRPAENQ